MPFNLGSLRLSSSFIQSPSPQLRSSSPPPPPPYVEAVNMGNRHSSQDRNTTSSAPPKPRAVAQTAARTPASKSINTHMSTSTHSNNQPNDIWSPPPYSSQAVATPSSTSTTTSSDSPYSFLREFDTIFLVDDSTSMIGNRWREAEDAIAAIAPICTQHDGDGIDIYFLNHRSAARNSAGGYKNVCDAEAVRDVFKSVVPRGATPVGRRLYQILGPYMKNLERVTVRGEEASVKPLNIIVITDGVFTDDAESVIAQVAKQLDQPSIMAVPWQVGIQFFQVGDDRAASLYLQALDDELEKRTGNEGLRDIVDTVPWRGEQGKILNAEGILKCVLGAVNRKYDKRDASR